MPKDLPDPLPKKLNVGCGFDIRPGFLNVDAAAFHDPDLVADVTDLRMLPDGYFEEIVAQDVLEHFERSKTSTALTEWSRLLSPTGILLIRVPSMFHMIDLLANAEPQGSEAAAKIIHLIYGTQAYAGDYHLAGFTPSVLAEKVSSAGLAISEVRLRDEWLFDITAVKAPATTLVQWPRSQIERNRNVPEPSQPDNTTPHTNELMTENRTLRAEVAHRDALLTALYQSTSWKLTRPIRAVRALLLSGAQRPAKP